MIDVDKDKGSVATEVNGAFQASTQIAQYTKGNSGRSSNDTGHDESQMFQFQSMT